MNNDYTQFINNLLKNLVRLNYIKPGDLPNIDLYMDQLTTFMDDNLSGCKRHDDDKILTKTMINNYTKNNLLPPPEKKKYSKDHLYILNYIYYLKNILSINDIQTILNPLTDNFFKTTQNTNLDEIYKVIFDLCKGQVDIISKDVVQKAGIAENAFENSEDESNKDFLQFFSLVCLLCFDVYMKKNIIESLIDEFSKTNCDDQDKKKKKK